jgi:hypothetical protein
MLCLTTVNYTYRVSTDINLSSQSAAGYFTWKQTENVDLERRQ